MANTRVEYCRTEFLGRRPWFAIRDWESVYIHDIGAKSTWFAREGWARRYCHFCHSTIYSWRYSLHDYMLAHFFTSCTCSFINLSCHAGGKKWHTNHKHIWIHVELIGKEKRVYVLTEWKEWCCWLERLWIRSIDFYLHEGIQIVYISEPLSGKVAKKLTKESRTFWWCLD